MEREGDQGPDAASIKPVSSLRAKFENLHGNKPSENDGGSSKSLAGSLKPGDPAKQPSYMRASLDLPRPNSTWPPPQSDSSSAPRTPGPTHGSESPTKSSHKRMMTMVNLSSPQLAPLVQVESPKSPPPTHLFTRNQSRSPERIDARMVRKLSDRGSPHGSLPSTRTSTPGNEHVDNRVATPSASSEALSLPRTRSKSPIPPPINRAEKPKIPVKPASISSSIPEPGLGARPSARLGERRVSPFSTPPSSDEEHSPERKLPVRRSVDLLKRSTDTAQAADNFNEVRRASDPRLMGFTASKTSLETKDPRALGFSTAQSSLPPPQPNRSTKNTPPPTRSLPPLTASAKDARDLGFGGLSTPTTRQTPINTFAQVRTSPPSQTISVPTGPAKDARHFGFSTPTTPATPVDGSRPDLPTRTGARVPPPRPSEDSKRPAYAPGIMRAPPVSTSVSIPAPTTATASRIPAQVSSNVRRSEDIPRQVIPSTSDIKFPPPPKRGTFQDIDVPRSEALSVPTPTITRRKSFDVAPPAHDSDEADEFLPEPNTIRHDYPDGSSANRRPPLHDPDHWQIHTKTDGKAFDICGRLLCTASYHTRIFDLDSGEEVLDLNHGETVKCTTVIFKPGTDIKSEGKRIWIGNNIGDIQEVDLDTRTTIAHNNTAHNRSEIFRILRHQKDIWTLDEAGKLMVWPADKQGAGVPDLKLSPITHKLHSKPSFAMVVMDMLWVGSGKEVRVYRPGRESSFNVLKGPLQTVQGAGDVTSGTCSEDDGRVYLGHLDGKVSIYSLHDFSCLGQMKVSDYKINAMTIVGKKLWAVYKTGKVYVYDTSKTPWKIEKDWRAHNGPATGILLDPSSVWLLGRMQVATTGHDQYVRLWDGLLEEDWVETTMHKRDAEFCNFRDVRASVTTWNCGATNPALLRTDFIADAIHADEPNPPEILVFGFQEVVDLEDRTVTAKSIFGFGKKKENKHTDQQYQSRVYRDWRDFLARSIDRYLPQHEYTELHTSSLIGLLQCVFVRTNERRNIAGTAGQEVKCGMGGHYGNKGALLCRFVMDSSSLCFVNCHLAAGQSQTSHRNNDVATILESEELPAETDLDARTSRYVGGGDGRQILDHEICILNGDLNYRIDNMTRAIVIKHIENGDFSELLKRDQLNVSRSRVAGFRLAPFTELPLTFPPTYKYDVGSDRYDSSEKKRSPAWCDRILYRSPAGRVKQQEYRRHEGVYYSDHRPVSGIFKIQVKKVDENKRKQTLKSVYAEFEKMRKQMLEEGCVRYLVGSFGIGKEEARSLIRNAK